jgi:hypothetical protein
MAADCYYKHHIDLYAELGYKPVDGAEGVKPCFQWGRLVGRVLRRVTWQPSEEPVEGFEERFGEIGARLVGEYQRRKAQEPHGNIGPREGRCSALTPLEQQGVVQPAPVGWQLTNCDALSMIELSSEPVHP